MRGSKVGTVQEGKGQRTFTVENCSCTRRRFFQDNKPGRSHLWPMIGKRLVNAYCRAWKDRNTDLKGADAAAREETSKQVSIAKLDNINGMMTADVASASSCSNLLSDDGTILPPSLPLPLLLLL